MDYKPGDHFTVKVGGVDYDTVIDPRGVQRFVENPNHWLIREMKDKNQDFNDLARRYHRREFSQRDYADFNIFSGYSVSGFCNLSSFEDMEISNPLWDD